MNEPRPEGYDPGAFEPFAVTVDIVLLTVVDRRLKVLLIRRGNPPYEGAWALPGGFVQPDEDLADAAVRELSEETAITQDRSRLRQIGAYGEPGRDPRMRVVTVAYLATVARLDQVPRGGTDATEAALQPVSEVRPGRVRLAFDHRRILDDALGLLTGALAESLSLRRTATGRTTPGAAAAPDEGAYSVADGATGGDPASPAASRLAGDAADGTLGESLALGLSPPEFTIRELQEVYEAVLDTELDSGNFQRKVTQRTGFITPTDRRVPPGERGGRPAALWRAGEPEGAE